MYSWFIFFKSFLRHYYIIRVIHKLPVYYIFDGEQIGLKQNSVVARWPGLMFLLACITAPIHGTLNTELVVFFFFLPLSGNNHVSGMWPL